jgi:hypothetical protein
MITDILFSPCVLKTIFCSHNWAIFYHKFWIFLFICWSFVVEACFSFWVSFCFFSTSLQIQHIFQPTLQQNSKILNESCFSYWFNSSFSQGTIHWKLMTKEWKRPSHCSISVTFIYCRYKLTVAKLTIQHVLHSVSQIIFICTFLNIQHIKKYLKWNTEVLMWYTFHCARIY